MEEVLTDPGHSRVKLPKLAVIASTVAFLLVLSALFSALHQISYLIAGIVPAIAGIMILRKRAWGAYGFALFEVTQSIVTPALLFRDSPIQVSQITVVVILGLAFGGLFFLAGRSLTAAGAALGSPRPWIAISLLFTLPFVFLRAYVMPSGSMENTLLIGDRVLVRLSPQPVPARCDLIVFRYPVDRHQIMIKRVIGLPGDRVRMVSRIVYVNGAALREPYVIRTFPPDSVRDNLPGDASDFRFSAGVNEMAARTEMLKNHVLNGDVVVPPHKYFVLGDNRDNSLDSRYWGFVDSSDIIGKPIMIYDSEAPVERSAPSPSQTYTRWNRIFKPL
jgi:signal peptidase I